MSDRLANLFGWTIAVPTLIFGIVVMAIILGLGWSISSILVRQLLDSAYPLGEAVQDIGLVTVAGLWLVTNRRLARLQRQIDQYLPSTERAD